MLPAAPGSTCCRCCILRTAVQKFAHCNMICIVCDRELCSWCDGVLHTGHGNVNQPCCCDCGIGAAVHMQNCVRSLANAVSVCAGGARAVRRHRRCSLGRRWNEIEQSRGHWLSLESHRTRGRLDAMCDMMHYCIDSNRQPPVGRVGILALSKEAIVTCEDSNVFQRRNSAAATYQICWSLLETRPCLKCRGKSRCPHCGSNTGPHPYEGRALPLCYRGRITCSGSHFCGT